VHTWPAADVPTIPGHGVLPSVFNTATQAIEQTAPRNGVARMYVCGITPYDAAHLGHAATYIAFDLLYRAWLDAGVKVKYVQNITDIDDPLLERADATGVDWIGLADREIKRFKDDMTALRVLPPDPYVAVTEAMDRIVDWIIECQLADAVYAVDGDLYFDIHADPDFGVVSRLDEPAMLELFAARGGDPTRIGKRNPLDPILWLAARPNEPAWDTRLGHGRPGWHIECVAIALDNAGGSLDVQGGGRDLVFPHHEMSVSQAHVASGRAPCARAYVHAGMVALDGEKMSKSKGNLVFVHALRTAGHDPIAIRLAILANHYRSDWEWTSDLLLAAEDRLDRWRAALSQEFGPTAEATLQELRDALAADLDAPAALLAVDRWVDHQLAHGGDDASGPGLVARAIDALLGISL
jgi:L-cysteine:1D-myo-inositol 2-amino-2-deoxy-alpha-D-glucopyranoside ligase